MNNETARQDFFLQMMEENGVTIHNPQVLRSLLSGGKDMESIGPQGPITDMDGKFFTPPPEINTAEFGVSNSPPVNVEIVVDDKVRLWNRSIGKVVKNAYFKDNPDFIFNVRFACSLPLYKQYINPYSLWFNVFFGYYQIDVSQEAWGRPFGYSALKDQIVADDIFKLGKADWNYFSNMMFGVPEEIVDTCKDLTPEATFKNLGRQKVNNKEWDFIELDKVKVISAYLACEDDLCLTNHPVNLFWRSFYALSLDYKKEGVYGYPESFIPTWMKAKLYMCFQEADDPRLGKSYRTYFFGGTNNNLYNTIFPDHTDMNERFLDAQLEAIRNVMNKRKFKDLGF